MFIRFFLIVALIPLQSCSNTLVGEKLKNSFDSTDNPIISENTTKAKDKNKFKRIKKIESTQIYDENDNDDVKGNIKKENSISNNNRFTKQSTKSIKKVIFNPQPYRIILKLSGANPSAPAETVTKALRKAGVQFEVEKIERFEEGKFLKDTTLGR